MLMCAFVFLSLRVQEALEKVSKYRERIVILKEDRRSKKALVSSSPSLPPLSDTPPLNDFLCLPTPPLPTAAFAAVGISYAAASFVDSR